MYIKQVIIEGFKTYRDQTIAEPFSPKINTIVGPNGSGKSNFFHAIRFVFSDVFGMLRAEERQRLLHEGAGNAVVSAYVEVILDNRDRRAPVDKDEFRIRRTFGAKKDEYHVDKKSTTKSELMQLLETAGFSRSNPYYVVQQGRIKFIAEMSDADRLGLLKEIGGTKVYEERRKESLKVMHEAEGKRQHIQDLVSQLDEKLAELHSEREELERFQKVDRQRRSLEFTIYDREVSEAAEKLAQLQEERSSEAQEAGKVSDEVEQASTRLKELAREISKLEAQQESLVRRRGEVAKERTDAVHLMTQAELDVKEMQESMQNSKRTQAECNRELRQLDHEVRDHEQRLAQVQEELQAARAQEADLGQRASAAERRLQALYQKQGRSTQFKSQAERDAWIMKEVGQLEATIATKERVAAELRQKIQEQESALMELSACIGDTAAKVKQREEDIAQSSRQHAEMLKQRDELNNQRKELWRQDSESKERLARLKGDLRAAQGQLDRSMARDVRRALSAVKQITEEHNIQGVFGPLIEQFKCPKNQDLAVEVTAGNSLFNMVVDTDTTATKVLRYLNQGRKGRVTFIPLNRVKPDAVKYPTANRDVHPLIKMLDPKHPRFVPALQQVFGKTLLCRTMDVAHLMAQEHKLNGVTIQGEHVDRKISYRGGFLDPSRSKMNAMRMVHELSDQVASAQQEQEQHAAALQEVDNQMSTVLSEIQKLESKQANYRGSVVPLKAQLTKLHDQEGSHQQQLETREARLKDIERGIEGVRQEVGDHQAELGTELLANLTAGERQELEQLGPQLKQLQDELDACKAECMDVESRQQGLETHLSSNLRRRQQELQEVLLGADAEAERATLQAQQDRFDQLERTVASLTEREQKLESDLEAAGRQLAKASEEAEKLREMQDTEDQHAQDKQRQLDAIEARRDALQQRKADLEAKIRELGPLPTEAFEAHLDRPLQELHKLLGKANQEIKKFSHVNKKALDQFVTFTEQKEELTRRAEENARGDAKIRQLIETLDLRKDHDVQRTFRQVAKYFREIFAELAPGGHGDLVMVKRRREEEGADEEGSDVEADDGARGARQQAGSTEIMPQYTGVKANVSFGSNNRGLSGGQKTLMALALIFAIQRCDPAPFYLFDEIDAALDPQYRTTVAHMLAKQANAQENSAQFIITTFHPQFIQESDKVYGVSHEHRISRVQVVTKADARAFVESDEQHAPKY